MVAGDHEQLPPIVAGRWPEEDGHIRLHRSILEALRDADPAGVLTAVLLENFGMCDRLCAWPAASVYPAAYGPATPEIAGQRLHLDGVPEDPLIAALLDPEFPVVVCVFEDVVATRENPSEAALVADLAIAVREGSPDGDDAWFWRDRLFVVGPHHAQNRLVRRLLRARRDWNSSPFVDTVDKMQGQECDAVIVSYGVSDVEYALSEREFIYSRNRLNVAITRARAKTVVLLSRALLNPPLQALDHDDVADGVAYMQGLAHWAETQSAPLHLTTAAGRLTVYRG